MEENNFTSDLKTLDQKYIWHPFTQMKTARSPIPIVKGEGAILFSDDGHQFIDGISSWWVNLHGHAHPYIVDKMRQQAEVLEHVLFAGFTHAPAVKLATRLLSLLPGEMSKIFYSDNGSTAVETALKMAIQFWHNLDPNTSRTTVICLKRGYHGDTFGAMSAAGKNVFNKPFWKHLFQVKEIDIPFHGCIESSLQQLQACIDQGDAACFIFEPLILGAGGMITYPKEGLDSLLRLCRQHDIITIADEVMTGFGRTGRLFACDYLSEKPDIICLSKGLSGGFLPLGATACAERIYHAFYSDNMRQALLHGHTYTGNPIACTSALASLDLLLEECCQQQRDKIAASHAEFCQKWKGCPQLSRCEHLGTILILEYSSEETSYFQSIRERLYDHFIARGIILRPLGNVLYVMPPYCITREQLEVIYEAIEETLGKKK